MLTVYAVSALGWVLGGGAALAIWISAGGLAGRRIEACVLSRRSTDGSAVASLSA